MDLVKTTSNPPPRHRIYFCLPNKKWIDLVRSVAREGEYEAVEIASLQDSIPARHGDFILIDGDALRSADGFSSPSKGRLVALENSPGRVFYFGEGNLPGDEESAILPGLVDEFIPASISGEELLLRFRLAGRKHYCATEEQASQKYYRLFFEKNPYPLYVFDVHTYDFLEVNEAALQQYGFTREEFMRMKVTDLRSIQDRKRFYDAIGKITDEFEKLDGVWRHRRKDGTPILVEISRHLLQIGDHSALLVLPMDVTQREHMARDREEAFRELAEQRNLFSLTSKMVGLGGWTYYADSREIVLSDELLQLFGLSTENPIITDSVFFGHFAPEFRGQLKEAWHLAVTERRGFTLEGLCDPSLAPLKEVRIIAQALSNESGAPVLLQGAIQDISEFRAITKGLEESEERFRLLANASSDVIWDYDLTTGEIWWNDGFSKLFGHLPGERETDFETWKRRVHPEDRERVLDSLDRVFTEGKRSWFSEYRLLKADGTYAFVADRGECVHDWNGKTIRMVGGMTDLTIRKHQQEQQLHARRLESIGTLAGGIAHDFNNLLSPILMGSGLLRGRNLDELSQKTVTTIEKSALRGADLVKQLLAFAQGMEGEKKIFAPQALVREIVDVCQNLYSPRITVNFKDKELSVSLFGEESLFRQGLLAVCHNAAEAMPDKGLLTIEVDQRTVQRDEPVLFQEATAGEYYCVTITDTGEGIDPEFQQRIFEPFYTTKELGQGTGLGLSALLGTLRNFGGLISLSSEVGQGSSFRLYFPLASEKKELSRHHSSHPSPETRKNHRILVVDDEPGILEVAEQALQALDYEVLTAGDGEEALAIYEQEKDQISLVVTDMMMPRMNGAALIRALRDIDEHLPIIVASGYTTEKMEKELGQTPIQGFLSKPFSIRVLSGKIKSILNP